MSAAMSPATAKKTLCRFCGQPYINQGWHIENECAGPDPKPPARKVNPLADPFDSTPLDESTCPFCGRFTTSWQRHHVVPRGQGGDDVSENLVWVCAGCHRRLHDADRRTGALLYAYCNLIPIYREYATDKKWPGWLAYRYLGEDIWL